MGAQPHCARWRVALDGRCAAFGTIRHAGRGILFSTDIVAVDSLAHCVNAQTPVPHVNRLRLDTFPTTIILHCLTHYSNVSEGPHVGNMRPATEIVLPSSAEVG